MTRKQCTVCAQWFEQDEKKYVNCPAHSFGETESLERCGDCGAWQDDPSKYSEDEMKYPTLVHCGCKNPCEYV